MVEEAKKNITFQITQSVLQLEEAQKRVELTSHSVEQAEETLRLIEISLYSKKINNKYEYKSMWHH